MTWLPPQLNVYSRCRAHFPNVPPTRIISSSGTNRLNVNQLLTNNTFKNKCLNHNTVTIRTITVKGLPHLSGLRSFGDLTPHFTTRTDDSHAAPIEVQRAQLDAKTNAAALLRLVRFLVYCRIKPHTPSFIQTPANLFKYPTLRFFPRRSVYA